MSETGEPVVRIMGYIVRCFRVQEAFIEFKDGPNFFKGFFLDVTVEIASGVGEDRRFALIDYLGDGKFYPTFEEARDEVARVLGFVMEKIPEERWAEPPDRGKFEQVVAEYIKEFAATDRPKEEIVFESPHSRPNVQAKEEMNFASDFEVPDDPSGSAKTN